MTANRIVLVVSSIALAALLSACQCNVKFGEKGAGGQPGENPFGPGEDPAEQKLQRLNGKVTRDAGLPGNPVVEIHLFGDNTTDGDLKDLAEFTELRKLEIDSKKFTGLGFQDLGGLTRLEELDVSFTEVNDFGLEQIAKLKSLKVLNLMNATKYTDDGVARLAALENLEELVIGQNSNLRDVGVSKAVAGMKKLRKLDISNSRVGDGAMKALVGNKELRALICHGLGVTDAGYKSIGQMKNLEELKASYKITDAGLAHLAGLKGLRSLSVWNSSVSFAALRDSPLLGQLKELNLGGAVSRITDAEVDQLRAAAPNCNIRKD